MRAERWAGAAIAILLVSGITAAGARLGQLDASPRGSTTSSASAAVPAPLVPTVPPVAITPAPPVATPPAPTPPPTVRSAQAIAPALPVGPAGSPGETLALVVGIDDYPGRRFDLDFAGADATSVDAALGAFGVPAGNRILLRDHVADRDGLVAAVSDLAHRAGPGTTLVLAFAGHVRRLAGSTEAIVTADGELLTDVELAELLAPAQADRRWLLMATCFGGGFTEAIGPGDVLTAAAPATGVAYESSEVGGSHLVHHMVREGWLQGKAGSSVQEAFAYADARIAATRPDRRPVQYDTSGQPLRFGAPPAPAPGPAPGTAPPPAPSPTTTAPDRRCTLVVLCTTS